MKKNENKQKRGQVWAMRKNHYETESLVITLPSKARKSAFKLTTLTFDQYGKNITTITQNIGLIFCD